MQTYHLSLVASALALVLLGTAAIYVKLHRRLSKLDRNLGKVLAQLADTRKAVSRIEEKSLKRIVEDVRTLTHGDDRVSALILRAHRRTQAVLKDDQVQAGFVHAISTMYSKFPVFMGGAALDGYSARVLFDRIEQDRPRTILELGSGSSTVMIAALLEKLGLRDTRHISVDDSEHFLEITRRNFERHGFRTRTEFWHCPMQEGQAGEPGWYSGIVQRLGDTKLDLVLVDGPPGFVHPHAREPALPTLYPHLSDRAVVILDDAARKEEQDIMEAWKRAYPAMEVRYHRRGKGCAEFLRVSQGT